MEIWFVAVVARRFITAAAKACPKTSRRAGVVAGTNAVCASARLHSAATCSFIAPAAPPPSATTASRQITAATT